MPRTSACERRSLTSASRHERSAPERLVPPCLKVSAISIKRSGGIRAAVEENVFNPREQLGRNVFIHGQLSGVDDPHIHPGADGVVQKRRVHGFADRFIAAE